MPDPHRAVQAPLTVPVLIAGGGPVGLTLSALLARHGVASLVIEADEGYCSGSRAICASRRSLEILAWAGADKPLVAKALPRTGGRSYWRSTEVSHFRIPGEATQRYAPIVNLQQFYVEQFAHEAMQGAPELAQVHWRSSLSGVRQGPDFAEIDVETPEGRQTVRAGWVVACDGGRSTVRELLGLELQGTQYEGRYVIVDIVQKTRRPVERLAWFDPPSNPGSTLLMHRLPDDVWRIDYQLRDDDDAAEAVKPVNVLPRVESHLAMIGEDQPWKPLWFSMYEAKSLTLPDFRHGRVFFAGDAAHLAPTFGLDSGLDDAGNLAWKLARVVEGSASEALLDTYSIERVHAARENIAYEAKSAKFMAPPNFAFRMMREATLRLAASDPHVRALINPRQPSPVTYLASPLNMPEQGDWANALAQPGAPAPEALLQAAHGPFHLTQCFGKDFVCLVFGDGPLPEALAELTSHGVAVMDIPPEADHLGQARRRYGLPEAQSQGLVLVRPDGYVMGRWRGLDPAALLAAMTRKGLA